MVEREDIETCRDRFERNFKKVFNEIDLLRNKIYKKDAILWIIPYHVYKKEELLNSEHQRRIYSITEKIGDDVKNWDNQGKLKFGEKTVYNQYRNKVETELLDINYEIENREPTWWEAFQEKFRIFITKIMNNLPTISKFLEGIKTILKLAKKLHKFLPKL